MAKALSLRRFWIIYKRHLVADGTGKRELSVAHDSFYAGARGVLVCHASMSDRGTDQYPAHTLKEPRHRCPAQSKAARRGALSYHHEFGLFFGAGPLREDLE